MKIFIGVIIAATIIGGFVGGELTSRKFSITGAVVGGVGLAAVLLGLGAFFDAQDRKRRKAELPPEIRGVFDRMVGRPTGPARTVPTQPQRNATGRTSAVEEAEAFFVNTAGKLIAVQLLPKYKSPKDAFGSLMTNKRAAGYVFGFHDSLAQRLRLAAPGKANKAAILIEQSYKRTFGEQSGFVLYSMSVSSQEDPAFIAGRMSGGNELVEYMEKKVPPLGLGRILILKTES